MHLCGMFKEVERGRRDSNSDFKYPRNISEKKKSLGKLQSQCALHSFLSSLAIVIFLKFNVTQGSRFKLIE